MLQCPVEWQSNTVVLRVSPIEVHQNSHPPSTPHLTSSASHSATLERAQHILFFDGLGGTVQAAPLTVKVGEKKPQIEVAAHEALASPPGTGNHADALVPDATQIVEGEYWTDAVDDEAMAFFGDEDD